MRKNRSSRWPVVFGFVVGGLGMALAIAAQPSSDKHQPAKAKSAPNVPNAKPVFELTATDGEVIPIPMKMPPRLTVLCFLGAECPLARLYGPRLQKLADAFQANGVRFVGINSNRQDSMADVRKYVKEHRLTFPVVKDYDNKAADYFEATRTPEVVVLDQAGGIGYRGRIDDQYEPGIARTKPERQDLKIALEELLARKTPSVPRTEPAGCLIGKIRKTETTTKLTYCQRDFPHPQRALRGMPSRGRDRAVFADRV